MSAKAQFTVFCMESYKEHKSLTGKQVWELFEKYEDVNKNFDEKNGKCHDIKRVIVR